MSASQVCIVAPRLSTSAGISFEVYCNTLDACHIVCAPMMAQSGAYAIAGTVNICIDGLFVPVLWWTNPSFCYEAPSPSYWYVAPWHAALATLLLTAGGKALATLHLPAETQRHGAARTATKTRDDQQTQSLLYAAHPHGSRASEIHYTSLLSVQV